MSNILQNRKSLNILTDASLCRPAANTGITTPAAAAVAVGDGGDDDDEIDLFGSDDEEEDAENERIKAQRVAEYNKKRTEKEAVKGKTIAKSVVTLAVKPWDDETDLDAMEKEVRALTEDGLVWGASKKVPVGYGVSMIQFTLVIEDDKVRLRYGLFRDLSLTSSSSYRSHWKSCKRRLPRLRSTFSRVMSSPCRSSKCLLSSLMCPLFQLHNVETACHTV